jgi:hypothetical protein
MIPGFGAIAGGIFEADPIALDHADTGQPTQEFGCRAVIAGGPNGAEQRPAVETAWLAVNLPAIWR